MPNIGTAGTSAVPASALSIFHRITQREMLDGFSEQGSSFVPDGTRFVLARSPSDESLGYFRASLRDLGSRCILMRSNRLVVCEPFPVEPRMTRVSRTNAVSKVPSGRTTIAHGFNRGLRMQGRQEPR